MIWWYDDIDDDMMILMMIWWCRWWYDDDMMLSMMMLMVVISRPVGCWWTLFLSPHPQYSTPGCCIWIICVCIWICIILYLYPGCCVCFSVLNLVILLEKLIAMVIFGDWRGPLWTSSQVFISWLRLDEVRSHLPKTRVPMTTSTTSRPRSFQLVRTFQLAIQA